MDTSTLNDNQKQAVTAPLGPVLVLAGAGSGKTRVLAFRVAYLIEQGLIPAGHILALTFTNKAAKEMQERVFKLLGEGGKMMGASLPTMGTFHSVCAKILRQEIAVLGYTRGFAIFDADDQAKILREICTELDISKKFGASLFRAYISSAKNLVQTPEEMHIGLEASMHEMVKNVYAAYQNYLYKQNGLDFDDLLMLTIKIFELRPEVLKKYRDIFQYILVDEYQDTNRAQYVLLSLLASHQNLFVVGDDAQSIYGFRGSNIGNILSFERDYPEAKVFKLEQNYRSTKNILAAADSIIALNTEQRSKKLWTDNSEGPKIFVYEAEDEQDEGYFAAKKIISLAGKGALEPEYELEQEEPALQAGSFSILDQFLKKQRRFNSIRTSFKELPELPEDHEPLSQFAVLYRTHAQSRALEEAFMEAGIPYQIIGGVKFYERKEIKDMLAYLRLVQNFRDLVSLKRVVNEPARGIGDKSYQTIKQFVLEYKDETGNLATFREYLKNIQLPPKQYGSFQQFYLMIESFKLLEPKENLTALMRLVFKKSGLDQWLDDGTEIGEIRIDNVKELFNVAAKWDNLPWPEALEQFLEEVALLTEIDTLQDAKDAVTLMTLHSAKGLEFKTVFFVGLEEGVLPHSRSLLNPVELSEEIRLAYVGVTRARENLFLLYARSRRMFGNSQTNPPSRILRALPEGAIKSNSGTFRLAGEETTYEHYEF